MPEYGFVVLCLTKSKPSNVAERFVRIYRYVGAEGVAEFTILGFVVYGMAGKIRQFPPSTQKRPPFRVFWLVLHLFNPISGPICTGILPFTEMSSSRRLKFQRFGRVNFLTLFYSVVFSLLRDPKYTKHPLIEAFFV